MAGFNGYGDEHARLRATHKALEEAREILGSVTTYNRSPATLLVDTHIFVAMNRCHNGMADIEEAIEAELAAG